MDARYKERFASKWEKYFGQAEMPITFRYTNQLDGSETGPVYEPGTHCVIAALDQVRHGEIVVFDKDTVKCGGGRRYLGYVDDFDAYQRHIETFLSETERYKKSSEITQEYFERNVPRFEAPARYCVFTPWDKLTEAATPDVVIFFATPDVISGLFAMANFDRTDQNGVIAPWGSGCSSVVMAPFQETMKEDKHAVLGSFDVSARPYVGENELSFSVPFSLFIHLVDQMDEMFLTTEAWGKVRQRICTA